MKTSCLPAARAMAALVLGLLMLGLLGACASLPNPNPRDPLEPLNRQTHKLNDSVDRAVLKPVATFYRAKVPALVRTRVSNFFGNLTDAWSAVNSLMQFRLQDAEENFARFHLNTMFGLFGVFDIASDVGIERHREDFGQTLGRWGVPAGPYIVLPLLGPSTLRDTLALPVDWRYDLISSFRPIDLRNTTYAVRAVDTRSNLLRVSSVLEEASLDTYSFVRDAYLQRRRAEIQRDREEDEQDVPPALPEDGSDPVPNGKAARAGQPAPAPAR